MTFYLLTPTKKESLLQAKIAYNFGQEYWKKLMPNFMEATATLFQENAIKFYRNLQGAFLLRSSLLSRKKILMPYGTVC
jgi:hypothetical protein